MSVLFYYEPFLFLGQLGIKGALPGERPRRRRAAVATRLRLICDDSAARRFVKREYSSNWDLFARLLKSLTVPSASFRLSAPLLLKLCLRCFNFLLPLFAFTVFSDLKT